MAKHYRLSNGSVPRCNDVRRFSICEKYDSDWKGVVAGDLPEGLQSDRLMATVEAPDEEEEELDSGSQELLEGLATAPPQLEDWSPEHVASWALSLGLPAEAAAELQRRRVGGQALQGLTAMELMGMGFNKIGHLRQLLTCRQELIERSFPEPFPERENLPPTHEDFEDCHDPNIAEKVPGGNLLRQSAPGCFARDTPRSATPLMLTARTCNTGDVFSPRSPNSPEGAPTVIDNTRLDLVVAPLELDNPPASDATPIVSPAEEMTPRSSTVQPRTRVAATTAASVPTPGPGAHLPVVPSVAPGAMPNAMPKRHAVTSPTRGILVALPGNRVGGSAAVAASPGSGCKTARVVITTQYYSPPMTGFCLEAVSPHSREHHCGSHSPCVRETVVISHSRSPVTTTVSTPGGRHSSAAYVTCTPGRKGNSLLVATPCSSGSPRVTGKPTKGNSAKLQPAAPKAPPLSWSPPVPAAAQQNARSPGHSQSWAPPLVNSPHRARAGRARAGTEQLDRICEQSPPHVRPTSPCSWAAPCPWAWRTHDGVAHRAAPVATAANAPAPRAQSSNTASAAPGTPAPAVPPTAGTANTGAGPTPAPLSGEKFSL